MTALLERATAEPGPGDAHRARGRHRRGDHRHPGRHGHHVAQARSDAGGAFELPVPDHDRYLVVCAADQMEPQAALVHTTGGDGCTFRLAEVVR